MLIKFIEFHRGLSKSSTYYFVIDNDKLIHISRYAVSTQRKYSDSIEYSVEFSKIRDKKIVMISSSNSGIICGAYIFDAGHAHSFNERYFVSLDFLNEYSFEYLSYEERRFLRDEWRQYYLKMINEIRSIRTSLLEYDIDIDIEHSLIQCQISGDINYPLSFLIPYSENARRASLESLSKQIHQIWVALRMFSELLERGEVDLHVYSAFNGRRFIRFKQGSRYPLYLFRCGYSMCSVWYEFETTPHTFCEGMLWNRGCQGIRRFFEDVKSYLESRKTSAPLRPDLVILRDSRDCDDICVNGLRTEMIIECKDQDYVYWANKIETQVIPYDKLFRPNMIILASMKKIPESMKIKLRDYGLIVIDEVYPGGRGEKELLETIIHYLI
jgi:hypothetical protein